MAKKHSIAFDKIKFPRLMELHHTIHRNRQNYSCGNSRGSGPMAGPLPLACSVCLIYSPSCICWAGWLALACGCSAEGVSSWGSLPWLWAGTGATVAGPLHILTGTLPSGLSALDPSCNQGNGHLTYPCHILNTVSGTILSPQWVLLQSMSQLHCKDHFLLSCWKFFLLGLQS